MEGYFLLFDATRPQCTNVAKRLRTQHIRNLDVKSLEDPRVIELFARAKRSLPDRPALVHADQHALTVYTGIAMRVRLANMLGIRRAADIAGLVSLEADAHQARVGDGRHRIGRRGLLGGTAAGAGALLFGIAMASAAMASPSTREGAPLSVAVRQRLLVTPTLRRASRLWGAVDEPAITTAVAEDGMTVALLPHVGGAVAFTAVSLDSADIPAITITPTPNGVGVRYFLADTGTPLVEQTVHNGQVTTAELDASTAPPGADPTPRGRAEFIACFLACMNWSVSDSCLANCIGCAGGSWIGCARCGVCAGTAGVRCANNCKEHL